MREPRARGPLSVHAGDGGAVAVSTAKINRMGFDSATLSPRLMNRVSAVRGILRGFRSFVRSAALSPFPSPAPTNPGGRARYPKIRRPERAQKSSRGASIRRPAAVIVVQPDMFVPYRQKRQYVPYVKMETRDFSLLFFVTFGRISAAVERPCKKIGRPSDLIFASESIS